MCTGLDPDFNVWEGIAPYAQKLIADELGPAWQEILDLIGSYGRVLVNIPRRLDTTLTKLEQGDVSIKTPELTREVSRLERQNRRMVSAVIFAGLLISGTQLYLAGEFLFAGILLGASVFALLKSIFVWRK